MTKSDIILRVLEVALWIRVTIGFVCQMIFVDLAPAIPIVYLAFDGVIVALGCWTLTHRRDVISGAILLVVSALVTIAYNHESIFFYLNGIRDFLGYLFVLPVLRYLMADERRWESAGKRIDRFIYLYLWLQFPCMLIQFLYYGAGDHVGGSLGDYQSGMTSTLLFLGSFYLIHKRLDRNRLLASLWENKQYLVMLFPAFLNETKVSFVFLALYLLLLLPFDRKMFIRLTLAIPVMALLLYGAAVTYLVTTGNKAGDVFSIKYYAESYLLAENGDDTQKYAEWLLENDGDRERDSEDVPRFSKFLFLFEMHEDEPGKALAGWGVGHFKGGTLVPNSDFYQQNEWLLIGTIPYLFHVLVQLGWLGVALMAAFFGLMLFRRPVAGAARDYNLQFYVLALLLLIMVYQDFLRNVLVCFLIFYVMARSWTLPREERQEVTS